jgi:hypothetical protein
MSKVSLGTAKVISVATKAVHVELEDYGKRWIPLSVIHDDSEIFELPTSVGEHPVVSEIEGELVVQSWWAEKEGIV